jgi:hypothetical protein
LIVRFRRNLDMRLLVLAAATAIVVLIFVGTAVGSGQAGFPLDDAWIHQTYARNLVEFGRWEYSEGVISSGSTSPLWTVLLAAGYLMGVPYLIWSYLLGAASLLALALGGQRLWRLLWPEKAELNWIAALAILLTWPLVWAAVSGMETLLFASLGLWIIILFVHRTPDSKRPSPSKSSKHQEPTSATAGNVMPLGILTGLLILTRPEGVVLLLLLGVGLGLEAGPWKNRASAVVLVWATATVLLVPFLMFNLWASGNLWPNTLYAKQVEYSVLLSQPLLSRLARLLFFNLGGPEYGWRGSSAVHLLLLPGLIVAVAASFRWDWGSRRVRYTLPLLWAGGHVLLYAWRLPVTYQHGRYLLAATSIWVLYGLSGSHRLLTYAGDRTISRLVRRAAIVSFSILTLIFLLLGAQAYATDVAFIEGEMVDVAHWLAHNTPPDALVATHDIGAIGYFSDRSLLDLAGLISPEIIPWLADESTLARYVLDSDADYLVSAPGWPYAAVASAETASLVYTTGYLWTQEQGENNMQVYELSRQGR